MSQIKLFPDLIKKIQDLENKEIPDARKEILANLRDFVQNSFESQQPANLNFICTHNSRRSQLGQAWAKAVSVFYDVPAECYSGGTEVTSFHKNAREALLRAGFKIWGIDDTNRHFRLAYSDDAPSLPFYSKLYDSAENPTANFAAVMTCSHADENCPFIPGATARIALDYQDPKEFDGTHLAAGKYDERSDQIAAEMIYVFKKIRNG